MPNKVNSYSGSACSTGSEGEGSNSGAGATDSANKINGTKRRASRAGTRSVSTLSAAQLARKRANDRDAQRAIRQRTKERVEDLERQVLELSAGRPDDISFQVIQQRNRELEHEIQRLHKCMADTPAPTPPGSQWGSSPAYFADASIPGSMNASPNDHLSLHDLTDSRILGGADRARTSGGGSWGPNSHPFDPLLRSSPENMGTRSNIQTHRPWVISNSGFDSPPPMAFDLSPRYAANTPFGSHNLPDPIMSPFGGHSPQQACEMPVRWLPASNMTDTLIMNLIAEQRNVAIEGVNVFPHANARSLVYLGKDGPNDAISSTLCDILHGTPLQNLAEKAASLYLLHKLVRWTIFPRQDTYDAIPDWFTPRPSQLLHSHPFWASVLAHPKLRDKVISNQDLYATDEFEQLYLMSMSVNWPYSEVDILSMEDGELRISPLFEKHICCLDNWTFASPFSQRYPELASVTNFAVRHPAPVQGLKGNMEY